MYNFTYYQYIFYLFCIIIIYYVLIYYLFIYYKYNKTLTYTFLRKCTISAIQGNL